MLRPYVPGRPIEEVQREYGLSDVVKLASNENPLGPSPLAIQAIADYARFSHLYPDAGCVNLRAAVAEQIKIPESLIVVGNGSDEMIHLLSLLLLKPGDSIVMGSPGFSQYEAGATAVGALTRKVPLDTDARHDLPAMLAAIDETTRIVWIANPNNPTGTIVRRSALADFVDRVPDDVAIVLDEAYFEFATDPQYADSTEFDRPNVIGLRTFSKTYGLAGLRVGYAIAPEDIAVALNKIRSPFNVNALAQHAALAALNDRSHLAETVRNNADGVDRLRRFLTELHCKTFESFANFVWADIGVPTDRLCEDLLRQGVIVRPGSAFGCPTHLRISVGTPSEMDRFEEAFSEILRANYRA